MAPDDATTWMTYTVAVIAYVVLCKFAYNVMFASPDEQLSDLTIAKTAVLALVAFVGARGAVTMYQSKKLPFDQVSSTPTSPVSLTAPVRGPVGRQLTSLVPKT